MEITPDMITQCVNVGPHMPCLLHTACSACTRPLSSPPLPPVRYGLMSKISTGHSMVDVFLCLLVPMLIRQLLPFLMDVVNRLMRRDGKQEHQFTRHVEHTNRTNYYWW